MLLEIVPASRHERDYRRSSVVSKDGQSDIPRIVEMISRGCEAGVKALDREAASAAADGLDSGRASATLLLSGNVFLGMDYMPIPNP